MTGFVYAIDNGNGFVKIGWANDPYRRLAELNVASPEPMRLIGFIEGGKDQEKAAHFRLRSASVRGEWFRRTDEVEAFLSRLTPATPAEPRRDDRQAVCKAVAEIIDAFPSRTDFGRACGFTRNPVARASDMRRRGSIPLRYWSSIVAHAKGIDRRDITLAALAKAHAPHPEPAE